MGINNSRYVFVGGLHRSGTSLLARLLGAHPEVEGIEGAPVPENEGVFLQGAIPHTARDGVPGAFAQDPVQHLTEASPLNTLATRDYLEACWDRWYPGEAPWRVEKSPVNLLRARLYQQLLPTSQFVFVTRHPAAACGATAKWSGRGAAALLGHWGHAHDLLLGDLPYLHCWIIVRYEDLTADPAAELARVCAFLGLPAKAPEEVVREGLNEPYFEAWPEGLDLPESAAALGYGLDPPSVGPMRTARGRHYFNERTALIA